MKSVKIKVLSTIITCCVMICVILGGVFLTKGFKSLIEAAIEGGITGGITQDKIDEGTSGGVTGGGTTSTMSAYGWYGSGTEADPYQIRSKADLKLLADYVGNVDYSSGSSSSGFGTPIVENFYLYFSNAYFILTNDIDCGGEEIVIGKFSSIAGQTSLYMFHEFCGIFDGRNFSITNRSVSADGNNDGKFSLFMYNRGTIKNVKFSNWNLVAESYGSNATKVSIIAMQNRGTIDNCIISNIKITSDRYKSNCNIYCIGTVNLGQISNCYVTGITVNSNDSNGWTNADGATVKPFISHGDGSLTKCVFNRATYAESGEDTSFIAEDFTAPSYCYTSTDTSYSNLGEGLEVGGSDLGDKKWYFSKEYSSWPMLRSFISWREISFKSADTNQGTVTKSSIQIPSDAFENFATYYSNNSSRTSVNLNIYNQSIKASANVGYEFQKWMAGISSSVTITAYFTDACYYYTFDSFVLDGETITPKIYDLSTNTEFSGGEIAVAVGAQATVECKSNEGNTIITYLVGEYEITYTIPLKYTMVCAGAYNFQIWSDDPDTTDVPIDEIHQYHSEYHISYNSTLKFSAPTVKLKEYTANFPV